MYHNHNLEAVAAAPEGAAGTNHNALSNWLRKPSGGVADSSYSQALAFLELLGKPPAQTYFRTIAHGRGANKSRHGADLLGFDAAALEADNAAGSAVYLVMGNATGASGRDKTTGKPTGAVCDADCPTMPALFVEWDDKPLDWQITAWREFGLPEPSAVVLTGGKSAHVYWVLSEPMPADQWQDLQRRLIDYCGGDTQCKNPSRVMRLPGFAYVNKATGELGQRAELIHTTSTRYSPADLEACLPALLELPTATPASSAPPPPHRGDLPPRGLEQIEEAASHIPARVPGQGTYETSRRALCGCAAALAEISHPDPEGHALALLASKWPDYGTAKQALTSSTTREAATFWAIAAEHGYNIRRRDLSRHPDRMEGFTDQTQQQERSTGTKPSTNAAKRARPQGFQPRQDSQARWGLRRLNHTRRMACFDRCVWVLAARERNSLRRRAALLRAARALELHQYINRQEISQRVLEAKDQQQGNSYRGLTAADRLAMEWPEIDWLIPDLLPANDLSIIGGRPKVGKTAMAMAIAAAVLKAQPVAGFMAPTATRPVIVVSDDQGDADTKRAMDQLGIFDHPSLIWSRRFRLTESDLDQLLADVRRNPGALVIIDSLRSVSRALQQGENDPEIGAVIYDLKAAVMDAGGSVLLVHHCNKATGLTGVEALSGHNAIAGAVNTVITLHYVENAKGQPDKEADQRRMVREGRTGKPLDWVISRTAGSASFHQVGTWSSWQEQIQEAQEQAKREGRQTGTQRDVLEVLEEREGEWLTVRQVVEAMGLGWGSDGAGKDANRVRSALSRLAADNQIERVRAGREYTFRVVGGQASPHIVPKLSQNPQSPQSPVTARVLDSEVKPQSPQSPDQPIPPTRHSCEHSEDSEIWPQNCNPLGRKDSEDSEVSEALEHPPSPARRLAVLVDGEPGWHLPSDRLPRSGTAPVISPQGQTLPVAAKRIAIDHTAPAPAAPAPAEPASATDEFDEFESLELPAVPTFAERMAQLEAQQASHGEVAAA